MSCGFEFIKKHCNYKNDYMCQRKCNIHKLKQLYNKELRNYYKIYNTYLEMKYSTGNNAVEQRQLAEKEWRPLIVTINKKLNKILKDLKKNIDNTQKLIKSHKKTILVKNNNILTQNKFITRQDDIIKQKYDEYLSKERQVDTGEERNKYKKNTMILMIILNIILVIVTIVLIIRFKRQ
jgi:septal ring factor EnvC (AmiA/AmiB activator)